MPTLRELFELCNSTQQQIKDYCIANEEDDQPSLLLTVGVNRDGSRGYKTGDNCFTGGAYGFSVWGVTSLYRDSDCWEEAMNLLDQIKDQLTELKEA